MSGIYIPGMEMPKDKPLIIKINSDGTVNSTFGNGYKKYKALNVPDHGRLIDADELYNDINESVLLTDGFKDTFNLWFDEQPVVIPADA